MRTRKSHLRYWRAADGRCPDVCVWSRRWRSPRPPGSSDPRRRSGASTRGERGSDPSPAAAVDHQIAPRGSARSPTPDAARWTEPEPGRSPSTLRWWWPALYRNPTRRSSSPLHTRRVPLSAAGHAPGTQARTRHAHFRWKSSHHFNALCIYSVAYVYLFIYLTLKRAQKINSLLFYRYYNLVKLRIFCESFVSKQPKSRGFGKPRLRDVIADGLLLSESLNPWITWVHRDPPQRRTIEPASLISDQFYHFVDILTRHLCS